jgi:hypothetical protein
VPLWIKPDRKLTVADVIGFMRDHFEGTGLDMTEGPGAGPHDFPYRWTPLVWETGEEKYFHERPVSTQQTGFSFVAQSRSRLPDPIGGVLWFGVDDTYSTVYIPVYSGVTSVPRNFAEGTGSFHDVDFDAAFWVFNRVSNFAYLRYSDMIVDIRKVQGELEGRFLAEQAEIDQAAVELHSRSPRLAREYLTGYTADSGAMVIDRWKELGGFLLYKYLDGTVKDPTGKVTRPGYPESWYENVARDTGDRFMMKKMAGDIEKEEKEKNKARELRDAVLTVLESRKVPVDEKFRKEILEVEDSAKLEEMLVRAASAETAEELLPDR